MYGRGASFAAGLLSASIVAALALQALLLGATLPARAQQEEVVFDNTNVGGVQNDPSNPTMFTLDRARNISFIQTYHWNNGRGAAPGQIALLADDGTWYGPWQATGRPGSGGVANAYWEAYPNETLPAGRYMVLDSDADTWARNAQSNDAGFTLIRATPGGTLGAPPGPGGTPSQPPGQPTGPPSGGGTIEGVVRNAVNGQPLAGATVSAAGRSTTSDSGGRY